MTTERFETFWVHCREGDEDAVAVEAPSARAAVIAANLVAQAAGSVNVFDLAVPYYERFPEAKRNYRAPIRADKDGNVLESPSGAVRFANLL